MSRLAVHKYDADANARRLFPHGRSYLPVHSRQGPGTMSLNSHRHSAASALRLTLSQQPSSSLALSPPSRLCNPPAISTAHEITMGRWKGFELPKVETGVPDGRSESRLSRRKGVKECAHPRSQFFGTRTPPPLPMLGLRTGRPAAMDARLSSPHSVKLTSSPSIRCYRPLLSRRIRLLCPQYAYLHHLVGRAHKIACLPTCLPSLDRPK